MRLARVTNSLGSSTQKETNLSHLPAEAGGRTTYDNHGRSLPDAKCQSGARHAGDLL